MADLKISELVEDNQINSNDLFVKTLSPAFPGSNRKMTAENLGIVNTNSNLTTVKIGGIEAGSSVLNETPTETLNRILYEYLDPSFSSFSLNINDVNEVGYSVTGIKTFTWTTLNSGNVKPNTINIVNITAGGFSILLNGANTGTFNFNFSIFPASLNTAGTYQWKIIAQNTNNEFFELFLNKYWRWAVYSGTSTKVSLTAAEILALSNKQLMEDPYNVYNFNVPGYKYICVPSSPYFPQLDRYFNFFDANLGTPIDMGFVGTVAVTNVNGITINYDVYRTTYVINYGINIEVK